MFTCNLTEDVDHGIYLNLSKNIIKIKRSSVLLSSFVSVIGLSSLLLFERLSGLDYWSSYQWYGVNSIRSHGQLVKMVLVE